MPNPWTIKKCYFDSDIAKMSNDEYLLFKLSLKSKAFRLIGVFWKKSVRVYRDEKLKAIVVEYA